MMISISLWNNRTTENILLWTCNPSKSEPAVFGSNWKTHGKSGLPPMLFFAVNKYEEALRSHLPRLHPSHSQAAFTHSDIKHINMMTRNRLSVARKLEDDARKREEDVITNEVLRLEQARRLVEQGEYTTAFEVLLPISRELAPLARQVLNYLVHLITGHFNEIHYQELKLLVMKQRAGMINYEGLEELAVDAEEMWEMRASRGWRLGETKAQMVLDTIRTKLARLPTQDEMALSDKTAAFMLDNDHGTEKTTGTAPKIRLYIKKKDEHDTKTTGTTPKIRLHIKKEDDHDTKKTARTTPKIRLCIKKKDDHDTKKTTRTVPRIRLYIKKKDGTRG